MPTSRRRSAGFWRQQMGLLSHVECATYGATITGIVGLDLEIGGGQPGAGTSLPTLEKAIPVNPVMAMPRR
jgi:hypothetical protein